MKVHAGKHFKALIDSGAAISLMCMSIYNMIEDNNKTFILPAAVNLQTADGSHMSSRGKATLYLQTADFKFSHAFVICDCLHEADFLFGIDLQKWYSLSYCWDSDRYLFIQREGSFITHTRNKEDLHNIVFVKSTLKIPTRHNGTVPIKFRGHNLQDQVAYFISNQHTKKGIAHNIHIFNSI